MTQPILDITAANAAAAAQSSQNTTISNAPWPAMQPNLGVVNSFNEIFAGTAAGSIEFKKQLKSVNKSSLDPQAMSKLQEVMANFQFSTELTTKILGFLSTALKTLNSMQ